MRDVLSLLSFKPIKSQGSRLRGTCPIHELRRVRRPDFSVDLDKSRFRCFGCGKGGNQLDLWVFTQDLPLHPAAVDLCNRLGIAVPWR
jgi:DNA primase